MTHRCMTLMQQYFSLGAVRTSYLHVLVNAFMHMRILQRSCLASRDKKWPLSHRTGSLQKRVRTFSAVCTDGIISGDFLTQEIRIDHAEATIVPRRNFQEPLTLELKNFVESIEGKAKI